MSDAYRVLGLLKTGALALGLAGLAFAGALPAAAQEDEPQAEASAPQTIGQYARHYRVYQRNIDELRNLSFLSTGEVHSVYTLVMNYEPSDLTRGWLAHQALVASRAPGFMETVRTAAGERGQGAFFQEARSEPSYMWTLSANTAAINFVLDGLFQDAREARAVGRVLNERAYAYMDRVYGSALPPGSAENANELLGESSTPSGERGYDIPYRAQFVMERVLTLAAHLSLEGAGRQNISAAGLLVDDYQTNQCLRWARLNLDQCMAAARMTAEEAYCTGRHGIDDVADCWGWMVNMDGEIEQAALGNN